MASLSIFPPEIISIIVSFLADDIIIKNQHTFYETLCSINRVFSSIVRKQLRKALQLEQATRFYRDPLEFTHTPAIAANPLFQLHNNIIDEITNYFETIVKRFWDDLIAFEENDAVELFNSVDDDDSFKTKQKFRHVVAVLDHLVTNIKSAKKSIAPSYRMQKNRFLIMRKITVLKRIEFASGIGLFLQENFKANGYLKNNNNLLQKIKYDKAIHILPENGQEDEGIYILCNSRRCVLVKLAE